MKKLNRACLVLICSILVMACSSPHLDIFPELSDSSLLNKTLPVDALRADVEAFYQGALERHPALEQYVDKRVLEQAVAELQGQITQPMNRLQFYRIVGKLAHKFNDGHSFLLWPYQEYQQLKAQGQKAFPFTVTLTPDGEVLIKHAYTDGEQSIPAGAKITAINGHGIQQLMAHMQQFVGGESRFLREQIISQRFGLMLWAVYGFINDFELQWQAPATDVVQSTHLQAKQNWQAEQKSDNDNEQFYFKTLADNTGYLYVGHFDVELDWFRQFIDRRFTDIQRQKLKGLIIDLRDNPGGNTDTATYLLSYIAHRDFRMISHMTEKLNQQNRGLFNYKGEAGELIQQDWNDWESPIDSENRFEGRTFVLISPITYSAAIVFASAAQDHKFATLVGQKTEGYANQTAQGNLFNLPHSQLRAYITTRMLVRPSGDDKVSGVIPDIAVAPDAKSIAEGYDPAVNKVLSLPYKAEE